MEMAAKTSKDQWWKYGRGGTVWKSITYDPKCSRVYVGTGNGCATVFSPFSASSATRELNAVEWLRLDFFPPVT